MCFPNLGADDVKIPGTGVLAFSISLTSHKANRIVVQNLGCIMVKKMIIRFSGYEVTLIDDIDVFHCYHELWRTVQEGANAQ